MFAQWGDFPGHSTSYPRFPQVVDKIRGFCGKLMEGRDPKAICYIVGTFLGPVWKLWKLGKTLDNGLQGGILDRYCQP